MGAPWPNLLQLETLESRGRTTHVHWDGVHVEQAYWVDPFTSAPAVVEALQGSVYSDPDGLTWTRLLPAQDPYYPWLFCNEARLDHIDPEKNSIACSPKLDAGALNDQDVPAVHEANYARLVRQVSTIADRAAGGAMIHASYRPLVSAYEPVLTGEGGVALPFEQQRAAMSRCLDFLDPKFDPVMKTVNWPAGLVVFWDNGAWVVQDQPAPIRIPVEEFTIRRTLVGQVPWTTISRLSNNVNQSEWPAGDLAERLNLPTFKPWTLRFDGADVINHYSSLVPGKIWYELVYHFSWINFYDTSTPVFTSAGVEAVEKIVHWNHILMKPEYQEIDLPLVGPLARGLADLAYPTQLGWHVARKVLRGAEHGPAGVLSGTIHPRTDDFNLLFELNSL